MRHKFAAALAVVAAATLSSAVVVSARAGDVIGEWSNAKAPSPPEVKPVTVDAEDDGPADARLICSRTAAADRVVWPKCRQ